MQCRPLQLASSRLRSGTTRAHFGHRPSRRLGTSTLQTLADEFLDLSLAIPFPESFPPYASTIILATILSRLLITLPFSLWAKERQWRLEELALPELIAYRNVAAKEIAQSMKYQKQWKDVDEFKKEHISRLKPAVEAQRQLLFKKHSCSPTASLTVPAISQIPLFVSSTIFFSYLSQRPTPLDEESFWTLTSMARPDPTATVPIALGLVTLANVETAHWFVSEEKRERAKAASDAKEIGQSKDGALSLKPKDVIQGGLRMFSVARIIIGTMVDGSVLVYWLSSATFGLVQTWSFNWWYSRKTARLRGRTGASISI